jgi:hypothetical protein
MPMGDQRTTDTDAPARRTDRMVVGLITAPGLVREVAEGIKRRLPRLLSERVPEYEWEVVLYAEPLAGAVAGTGVDLVQLARRRLLDEDWQCAVCLTDLPLHVGRRPVTAHVSVTLGVGVISVPALGFVDLEGRALQAVQRVVDRLLTGAKEDGRAGSRPLRLRSRLRIRMREIQELSSPVGHAYVQDHGATVRFVTATGQGNLRLLIGLIRANRPWRLVIGLSRALVAALGVSAFGLTSPAIWAIAHGMPLPRMVLLTLGSLVAICATLIVAHHLWERPPTAEARDRVLLINVATALTVALGVLTLYLTLLLINSVCVSTLIVPDVLESYLHDDVDPPVYLRIAWVVSSLATLGGALGAAMESDVAVREAAYGYRPADHNGEGRRDG